MKKLHLLTKILCDQWINQADTRPDGLPLLTAAPDVSFILFFMTLVYKAKQMHSYIDI
jgi:hypothetical protein